MGPGEQRFPVHCLRIPRVSVYLMKSRKIWSQPRMTGDRVNALRPPFLGQSICELILTCRGLVERSSVKRRSWMKDER